MLELHPGGADSSRTVQVTTPDGRVARFQVETSGSRAEIRSDTSLEYSVRLPGGDEVAASSGKALLQW